MQQQDENTLIHWEPSRVRFNLTLILAGAVILFGLYQMFFAGSFGGGGEQEPVDATQQQEQVSGEAENQSNRGGNFNAMLLIVVGLGVGAYSWLTTPRQYRVYSAGLMILYGMPRRRTIHFRDIREVVNDRGPMGDPLRVYTNNRRRIPIQVREPEEMHRYLDLALNDFRRANPQYAPPPEPEPETPSDTTANANAPDAGPATAADSGNSPESPAASDTQQPPRNRPTRRRSLRDDSGDSDDSAAGNGNDAPQQPPSRRSSRRRSLRDDNDDGG